MLLSSKEQIAVLSEKKRATPEGMARIETARFRSDHALKLNDCQFVRPITRSLGNRRCWTAYHVFRGIHGEQGREAVRGGFIPENFERGLSLTPA